MHDQDKIADALRKEARNWFRTSSHPGEDVDDIASTSDATIVRWRAADRIEALEAALKECAAPFRLGDQDRIAWEDIAREFLRRQKIAVEALTNTTSGVSKDKDRT